MQPRTAAATFLFAFVFLFSTNTSAAPLKGLILTSPGIYHNYEYQTDALALGIAKHINIRFDVSLAETERWKTEDFGAGYDVIVYNICMADNEDTQLIANLRRQSADLNIPAVVLHCTMHSFRNTELWWPMYGLKTVAHEALGAMHIDFDTTHPILSGIDNDWALESDELYVNIKFEGQSLLSAKGTDGKEHSVAWLHEAGTTQVFGTTLGHSNETIEDGNYQKLLANAILGVTGNIANDGSYSAELESSNSTVSPIDSISKPEGIRFLGKEGQSCAFRSLGLAAGPCYLGCILHPFKWGEEAQLCKKSCEAKLPTADEVIADCMPQD